MQITYLVLAHSEPDQLARLARHLLAAPGDRVVVHIDATAQQQPFESALTAATDIGRVDFVRDRQNVRWGDFASVRATIAALRMAVRERPTDYYVLLSGADYPIRPIAALRAELASGAVYMTCGRMPDLENDKPLTRLQHFYIGSKKRSGTPVVLLNKMLKRLPGRNVHRGLEGHVPFGGSQWWALPHAVATAVLHFTDSRPRLVRFFSRSQNPDEMFFQTVVQAVAPGAEMRGELTFADWSRPVPPGSPATLVDGEFDRIETAADTYWIARKFDWQQSRSLLDRIDGELLNA